VGAFRGCDRDAAVSGRGSRSTAFGTGRTA
jgi:hypothetical protein